MSIPAEAPAVSMYALFAPSVDLKNVDETVSMPHPPRLRRKPARAPKRPAAHFALIRQSESALAHVCELVNRPPEPRSYNISVVLADVQPWCGASPPSPDIRKPYRCPLLVRVTVRNLPCIRARLEILLVGHWALSSTSYPCVGTAQRRARFPNPRPRYRRSFSLTRHRIRIRRLAHRSHTASSRCTPSSLDSGSVVDTLTSSQHQSAQRKRSTTYQAIDDRGATRSANMRSSFSINMRSSSDATNRDPPMSKRDMRLHDKPV
ncbi:hypothetical protein C8R44DRAFT_364495 [Mycena epipterygia]|nr:hypothetical protein C8R44DRAFT_364495 [Mycena epipterygia]